jgi:DNA-binding transcriptional LysR family regulator
MLRKIDWESQIGRRIRLRDLHVFSTVARCGSMAKAARQLGVSQPAVSEVIADLEHMLGVRLLDRGAHGVVSTMYGAALLKRTVTVFDELKQSIRDIEFLSDPTVGELRIGCVEALSGTILAESIFRFSRRFPRVAIDVDNLTPPAIDLPGLRERKYDCILCWLTVPGADLHLDDLNIEMLFDDKLVVAAGTNSQRAHRRRIDLAELIDEPWILPPPRTWGHAYLEEAFRAQGLDVPKASLVSFSIDLRTRLLAAGPYITVFATSVMRRLSADLRTVAKLPIDLSAPARPAAALVTLKNRTLSPLVEQFVKCVREAASQLTPRN